VLLCAGVTVAGSLVGLLSQASAVTSSPGRRATPGGAQATAHIAQPTGTAQPTAHTAQPTAGAAQEYVPPSQNLYLGDSGAAVLSVHARLAQLGYYPGPVDGK
jgi:peptidoglycan hydrolase-like protein with peptidoglycan-binding domain